MTYFSLLMKSSCLGYGSDQCRSYSYLSFHQDASPTTSAEQTKLGPTELPSRPGGQSKCLKREIIQRATAALASMGACDDILMFVSGGTDFLTIAI